MNSTFELVVLEPYTPYPIINKQDEFKYRVEQSYQHHSSKPIGNFDKSLDFLRHFTTRICLKYPLNAECGFNITLETLGVPHHYWRASKDTKVIYSYCGGTTNTDRCSGNLSRFLTSPDAYCPDGGSGPLCKVCANDEVYSIT